jgi:7-carboxy-7-deazaguanine synthase
MRAESTEPGSPRLKITEVFRSLQGEANAVGFPTTFIRLTGCPLRCQYCDTAYAFHGGEWRTVAELVAAARDQGARHVCITGGEPLAQKNCLPLLTSLCDAGFEVSLETSGALAIDEVDARVARVVDLKTPASGEVARNRYENLALLRQADQVKFVICDRADYEWSREQLQQHHLEMVPRSLKIKVF